MSRLVRKSSLSRARRLPARPRGGFRYNLSSHFLAPWTGPMLALRRLPIVLPLVVVSLAIGSRRENPATAGPAQEKRIPWTTSKVTGSPEPPHPYRVVPAFPKLRFKNPLHITNAPGTDRLFVLEHEGRIFSFPNLPD